MRIELLCNLLFLLISELYSLIWRPLTKKEIWSWYSPQDICMLRADVDMKLKDVIQTLCPSLQWNYSDECRVGRGHRTSRCAGPFSFRKSSYFKGFDGYTDSKSKPMHKLVEHLARTNTSLIAIGDSVMQQHSTILRCQLLREGGSVVMTKNNVTDRFSFRINNPTTAQIDFYFLPFIQNTIAPFLSHLSSLGHHFLILLNFGLHYHTPHALLTDMNHTFTHLLPTITGDTTRRNSIVWLETTHQNFPNPVENNGYFDKHQVSLHRAHLASPSMNLTNLTNDAIVF
jgi:hypothetical protein